MDAVTAMSRASMHQPHGFFPFMCKVAPSASTLRHGGVPSAFLKFHRGYKKLFHKTRSLSKPAKDAPTRTSLGACTAVLTGPPRSAAHAHTEPKLEPAPEHHSPAASSPAFSASDPILAGVQELPDGSVLFLYEHVEAAQRSSRRPHAAVVGFLSRRRTRSGSSGASSSDAHEPNAAPPSRELLLEIIGLDLAAAPPPPPPPPAAAAAAAARTPAPPAPAAPAPGASAAPAPAHAAAGAAVPGNGAVLAQARDAVARGWAAMTQRRDGDSRQSGSAAAASLERADPHAHEQERELELELHREVQQEHHAAGPQSEKQGSRQVAASSPPPHLLGSAAPAPAVALAGGVALRREDLAFRICSSAAALAEGHVAEPEPRHRAHVSSSAARTGVTLPVVGGGPLFRSAAGAETVSFAPDGHATAGGSRSHAAEAQEARTPTHLAPAAGAAAGGGKEGGRGGFPPQALGVSAAAAGAAAGTSSDHPAGTSAASAASAGTASTAGSPGTHQGMKQGHLGLVVKKEEEEEEEEKARKARAGRSKGGGDHASLTSVGSQLGQQLDEKPAHTCTQRRTVDDLEAAREALHAELNGGAEAQGGGGGGARGGGEGPKGEVKAPQEDHSHMEKAAPAQPGRVALPQLPSLLPKLGQRLRALRIPQPLASLADTYVSLLLVAGFAAALGALSAWRARLPQNVVARAFEVLPAFVLLYVASTLKSVWDKAAPLLLPPEGAGGGAAPGGEAADGEFETVFRKFLQSALRAAGFALVLMCYATYYSVKSV
eukprot:jgi/Mesen1/2453/ME000158S01655